MKKETRVIFFTNQQNYEKYAKVALLLQGNDFPISHFTQSAFSKVLHYIKKNKRGGSVYDFLIVSEKALRLTKKRLHLNNIEVIPVKELSRLIRKEKSIAKIVGGWNDENFDR
ncbi:MAG: hypothetical protein V1655_02715 [bacterium]